MKKVIEGTVTYSQDIDDWSFETENHSYSADVCEALDQLLEGITYLGEKYKITIERLE